MLNVSVSDGLFAEDERQLRQHITRVLIERAASSTRQLVRYSYFESANHSLERHRPNGAYPAPYAPRHATRVLSKSSAIGSTRLSRFCAIARKVDSAN